MFSFTDLRRTGAGKSSLLVALYRICELSSGSISLDEYVSCHWKRRFVTLCSIEISTLALHDVRSKIAIIPQDPLLFSGTIRTNLDPFSQFDDARLWDALRRAHFVAPAPISHTTTLDDSILDANLKDFSRSRYNLETVVESEGSNFSVGERSLLSLARALVRDSKIIVLDEATFVRLLTGW